MSEVIRVLAVIAIIGYVIGRQLLGEPRTRPGTPGQVRATMSRAAPTRPLTWRHWPAWPVSGWQHSASGDGSP